MATKSNHSTVTHAKKGNKTYLPVEALLYPKVGPKQPTK